MEIVFEFSSPQELHSVQLYCNNQFTREVAVFSELRVYFSIGGEIFHPDAISYSPLPDEIFEEPRNVSVALHRRVARFVKLELHFTAKWILISEVSFDSSPARGNYSEEVPRPEPDLEGGAVRAEVERAVGEEHSSQMPVIVGCLATIILLLAAVIFFIVTRSRRQRRKLSGSAALSAEKVALNCGEAGLSLGGGPSESGHSSHSSSGARLSGEGQQQQEQGQELQQKQERTQEYCTEQE